MFSTKESPQAQRKRMIDKMMQMVKQVPFLTMNIDSLFKEFQFETGASSVKTKEYFEIVAHVLDFVEIIDEKKFIYRPSENEEKNLKMTIETFEKNAEYLKAELEKMEKNKKSTV